MTRLSDQAGAAPTPMDWIYNTRTYGLRIRFTTPGAGTIDWQGEYLVYQRMRFSIGHLSDMFYTVVDEMRVLLAQLTIVEKTGLGGLPPIPWATLADDYSDDTVGYSFLQDDWNAWVKKGSGWVVERILQAPALQCAWIGDSVDRANPYHAAAVLSYHQLLQPFRERLWLVMYMVSGQPFRTTEITGIRMRNTAHGGLRNILAHHGMMVFVTMYHK